MGTPDDALLKEAAQWLVKIGEQNLSAREHAAFEAWGRQSPVHRRAWRAAQELSASFQRIPAGVAAGALDVTALRRKTHTRRQALRCLGGVGVAVGGAALWEVQSTWSVSGESYQTAVGEALSLGLPDGSRLTMNTDTRVNVDRDRQLVWLRRGELFIEAGSGSSALQIITPQAQVRMTATRASISLSPEGLTRAAAIAGDLQVQTPLGLEPVRQGAAAVFSKQGLAHVEKSSPNDEIWMQGLLYADKLPLSDFLRQLGRYHHAFIHCDQSLADLKISGVYRVRDLSNILEFLVHKFPVKVRMLTRYLVSIEPDA